MAAIATAVVASAAAMALASVPGPNSVISGCYNKTGGALRVIDSGSKCNSNELSVSWNQTGPQGPVGSVGPVGPQGNAGPVGPRGVQGADGQVGATGSAGAIGPAGPVGPAGPTGPAGPAGAGNVWANTGLTSLPADGTSTTVASVSVPAGSYLISFARELDNLGSNGDQGACAVVGPITGNTQTSFENTSVPALGFVTVALQAAYTVGAGTIQVDCNGHGALSVQGQLSALQVTTIH